MRKLMLIAISVSFVIAGAGRIGIAEEELFDTKTATVHLEKGISLLKSKNYKAAVDELEEAVSIAPTAENFYYLGYAYYLNGRSGDSESRKKSIECFDKTYELEPRFTPTRYKAAEAMPGRNEQKESDVQDVSAVPPIPQSDQSEQPQTLKTDFSRNSD